MCKRITSERVSVMTEVRDMGLGNVVLLRD